MFKTNSSVGINQTKTRSDDTFSTPTLNTFPTDFVTGDDSSDGIKKSIANMPMSIFIIFILCYYLIFN
jgi:hypothetical protein